MPTNRKGMIDHVHNGGNIVNKMTPSAPVYRNRGILTSTPTQTLHILLGFYAYEGNLVFVYMVPLSRDEMRSVMILMYWNKSRLVIQQNISIFLGVDYTIRWPTTVTAK